MREALREELRFLFSAARAPKKRGIRRFAEEEIVIPDGPFKGERFLSSRQPFAGLLFGEIDSGRWTRFAVTGPSQSGKSLCAFVIPALWHLFELEDTVILGLPDLDMANDKWQEDLLPAIEQTKYRELLPRGSGEGGRRGRVKDAVRFRNGRTLKFMSGGGSDKAKAGFTARVLIVTEVDGMDKQKAGSREADTIRQLEARLRSYSSEARRTYLECTVSIAEGRIWQEYTKGSCGQIALPCPHCREFVTPEREHFVGHQEAETKYQAKEAGAFCCPNCGERWSEDQRWQANQEAVLVHRGQEVDGGQVVGDLPETNTLGFRWNAANNLLLTASDIAMDEFEAQHAEDEDAEEKRMSQFVWCVPYKPRILESVPLVYRDIMKRQAKLKKGTVPIDAECLTMAIDVNKFLLHYVVIAWRSDASAVVIEYGRSEVPSAELGEDKAILLALRKLREEKILKGWRAPDSEKPIVPKQVWIDANAWTPIVYQFTREVAEPQASGRLYWRFRPYHGRGASEPGKRGGYKHPTKLGGDYKWIGQECYVGWRKEERVQHAIVNADHWKSWGHRRLAAPPDAAGAILLHRAESANEHLGFAKHLTAEREVTEFVEGKGMVTRWEVLRDQNHWLDAYYAACAAGYFAGVRLLSEPRRKRPPAGPTTPIFPAPTPGRPYLITERR